MKTIIRVNKVPALVRAFGAKPASGGPPGAAPYVPPPPVRTGFEVLVEREGIDAFLFGPPKGIEKLQNTHRDYIIPKLASNMEFFAKKMRQQYHREGLYPTNKIYFDSVRERQPDDTLEKMHDEQLIAAVIEERDEFEDLDLVLPHRTPFTIRKTAHGLVRPFWIRHNDEEIMVTTNKITEHFKTNKPVHINFQRYIPGRPNLLTLPMIPVQEDRSLHF